MENKKILLDDELIKIAGSLFINLNHYIECAEMIKNREEVDSTEMIKDYEYEIQRIKKNVKRWRYAIDNIGKVANGEVTHKDLLEGKYDNQLKL